MEQPGWRASALCSLAASWRAARDDLDLGVQGLGHRNDRSHLRVARCGKGASDAGGVLADLACKLDLAHTARLAQAVERTHERVYRLHLSSLALELRLELRIGELVGEEAVVKAGVRHT